MNGLGRGLAAVAVMACLAGGAMAQSERGGRGEAAARAASRPETQRAVVSLDFGGGTVAEYVAALKVACEPQPVNVVMSEGAATDRLGPISLRQASLAAAMQAIPAASESGATLWQIVRLMDALSGEDAAADGKDSAPVYQVYRAPTKRDAGPQRVVMEVFSLQRIVGRETDGAAAERRIAAVLTAAETALQMDDHRGTPPDMKLHKESGLLIVRGEQDDVMAVKDVIERMSDDAAKAADEAARREGAARQMQISIARAELNARSAQSQLELASAKLDQIVQLVESGSLPSTEAHEMKAEVDRRRAEAEIANLEVEAARSAATAGGTVGPRGESADLQTAVARLQSENAALRARLEDVMRQLHEMQAAMNAGKGNNPEGK